MLCCFLITKAVHTQIKTFKQDWAAQLRNGELTHPIASAAGDKRIYSTSLGTHEGRASGWQTGLHPGPSYLKLTRNLGISCTTVVGQGQGWGLRAGDGQSPSRWCPVHSAAANPGSPATSCCGVWAGGGTRPGCSDNLVLLGLGTAAKNWWVGVIPFLHVEVAEGLFWT